MAAFNGQMNSNEFYNALFNAYRLYYMYSDNLRGLDDSLASRYRADGGMYHDQNVFTDMDVLYSRVWDPNDTNVLAPEAVVAPKQQKITTDKFRQIGLYTDEYLSKRAWMDPTNYDQFRSVVQKQVSETRRVFEQKLVDTFVGVIQNGGAQDRTLELPVVADDAEAQNRLQAQTIAKEIGDVLVKMKDTSNLYNKNGFLKSFNSDDFDVVWNAEYYNKVLYTDLPTIFHKENLLKEGKVLDSHYFGTATIGSTATANGTTVRARREYFIPVDASGAYAAAGPNVTHVFPGDLLPNKTPINATGVDTFTNITATINGRSRTVAACTSAFAYIANTKVICKIIHKDAIKYLSSFETGSEFWNPKNLTTNRYLTWAYAEPETLDGYPLITIVSA